MFTCPRGDLWCGNDERLIDAEMSHSFAAPGASGDDDALISPEWRRGELALQKGNIAEAIDADEDALRSFGHRIPRHRIRFALWLVWELAIQLAHCCLRRWLVGTRSPDRASDRLIAARHYGRLAYEYW